MCSILRQATVEGYGIGEDELLAGEHASAHTAEWQAQKGLQGLEVQPTILEEVVHRGTRAVRCAQTASSGGRHTPKGEGKISFWQRGGREGAAGGDPSDTHLTPI